MQRKAHHSTTRLNIKTVETHEDDMFQKKITDETGWLREDKTTITQRTIKKPVKEPEKDAGLIEQGNPLYCDKEYDVSFNNPMYSRTCTVSIAMVGTFCSDA